jgi:hypothetical protein
MSHRMSLRNLNPATPIADADLPASITRDSEYIAADQAHTSAANPHPQYLLKTFTGVDFGLGDYNVVDFHVNPSPSTLDFDARIIASGGLGVNGQCTLSVQAALLNLFCKLSIGGGAQVARLLVSSTYIDLPAIAAGGIYDIYMSIPGAQIGDIAFFVPTTELYNGLWVMHIQAAVTNNNVARIYFRNGHNSTVDAFALFLRKLV